MRRRPGLREQENRRRSVAEEAARLMEQHGLRDFRAAKAKAAERLGLDQRGALPSNAEVERALGERQRIFSADDHAPMLAERRAAALQVMAELEAFHPRLTGDLLSGYATSHSSIDLHVFADATEPVAARLDAAGIPARSTSRRLRMRRDAAEAIPGFGFLFGEFEFVVLVFPLRLRGHPPLSPVDGRPMRRAGVREVSSLLNGG